MVCGDRLHAEAQLCGESELLWLWTHQRRRQRFSSATAARRGDGAGLVEMSTRVPNYELCLSHSLLPLSCTEAVVLPVRATSCHGTGCDKHFVPISFQFIIIIIDTSPSRLSIICALCPFPRALCRCLFVGSLGIIIHLSVFLVLVLSHSRSCIPVCGGGGFFVLA